MRSPLKNWVEALPVYVLYGVLKTLPPKWASILMGHVLKLGMLCPIHKKMVQKIQRAFPEKTPQACQQIAKGVWMNLGQTIGEFPHIHKLYDFQESNPQSLPRGFSIEIQGSEYLKALREKKQMIFFFSGHLANWEISSIITQGYGLPLALVYRRPNNPLVDTLLRTVRGKVKNLTYLPKGAQGVKSLLKLLNNHVHVGMLMDQKMNEGPLVPFFNQHVPTATALVDLCLKFKGSLLGVQVIRKGPCAFKIIYHQPYDFTPSSDKEAILYETLCTINKDLEGWIRLHPEQWFWLHNRSPSQH